MVRTTQNRGKRSKLIRREQVDKAKTYAKAIKQMNVAKEAEKPKKDSKNAKKEVSKRDKAIEFAKQIRKPAKSIKLASGAESKNNEYVVDHMTYLEEQHRKYQDRVKELYQN